MAVLIDDSFLLSCSLMKSGAGLELLRGPDQTEGAAASRELQKQSLKHKQQRRSDQECPSQTNSKTT